MTLEEVFHFVKKPGKRSATLLLDNQAAAISGTYSKLKKDINTPSSEIETPGKGVKCSYCGIQGPSTNMKIQSMKSSCPAFNHNADTANDKIILITCAARTRLNATRIGNQLKPPLLSKSQILYSISSAQSKLIPTPRPPPSCTTVTIDWQIQEEATFTSTAIHTSIHPNRRRRLHSAWIPAYSVQQAPHRGSHDRHLLPNLPHRFSTHPIYGTGQERFDACHHEAKGCQRSVNQSPWCY